MEALAKVTEILNTISPVVVAVVIIATIIARLTPTPKDDKLISKISKAVMAVCRWLPTIGVNPETKKLKSALEEAQSKLK